MCSCCPPLLLPPHLFEGPCEPNHLGIKLLDVLGHLRDRVALRVDRHKHRGQLGPGLLLGQLLGLHDLLQLLGADVRALREPKVQQRPPAEQVLVAEGAAAVVHQLERAADGRGAHHRRRLLSGHDLFILLLLEPEVQPRARRQRQAQAQKGNRLCVEDW